MKASALWVLLVLLRAWDEPVLRKEDGLVTPVPAHSPMHSSDLAREDTAIRLVVGARPPASAVSVD